MLIKVKIRIYSTEMNILSVEDKCMWAKHKHTPASPIQMFVLPTCTSLQRYITLSKLYFVSYSRFLTHSNCNDFAISKCQKPFLDFFFFFQFLLHLWLPCWLDKYLKAMLFCTIDWLHLWLSSTLTFRKIKMFLHLITLCSHYFLEHTIS